MRTFPRSKKSTYFSHLENSAITTRILSENRLVVEISLARQRAFDRATFSWHRFGTLQKTELGCDVSFIHHHFFEVSNAVTDDQTTKKPLARPNFAIDGFGRQRSVERLCCTGL
jgi:hypothetical protein